MGRLDRRLDRRPISALSDLEIAAQLRGLAPISPKLSTNGARYVVRSDRCEDCAAWKDALEHAPALRELAAGEKQRADGSLVPMMPHASPTAASEPVSIVAGRTLCGLCARDRAGLAKLGRRVPDVGVVVRALDAIAAKKLSA